MNWELDIHLYIYSHLKYYDKALNIIKYYIIIRIFNYIIKHFCYKNKDNN